MNLYELFQIINATIGGTGKELSPPEAELMIHSAQLKHYNSLIGADEQYRPGQPLPQQSFEQTRLNSVSLSPFKVWMGKPDELPLRVNDDGYAITPSNMYYPSSCFYTYNGSQRPIKILSDNEWELRQGDALTKATDRNPIANIQNDIIRFSPIINKLVNFIYLKTLTKPVIAYNSSRGYLEYDSANSTELEWDESNQIDILYILLTDLGLAVNREDIIQVAEKIKTTGI